MKSKKEVKYREMTKNEELICVNLGNVRYGTGASFDKRLGNNLIFSTTLDGFYFANCVLAAVFFLVDYQYFRK